MKIDTQILDDHQAKLTVEIDAETMGEMKRRAARKITHRIKIPGFRPGKAPYAVIVRQVGEAAITEEALELLVQDTYPKIIDQSNIRPYGPGSLNNVISLDPPVLEFLVPLEPEVVLGSYRDINEPYELEPIHDEEIEKTLKELQDHHAILEPVERPAMPGDQVSILISADRINPEDGSNQTFIRQHSHQAIVLPEDTINQGEWPFPGFSRQLIGLSTGDEKTIEYTYPQDAASERLRGANAHFQIVIESVKSRTLPELNDEFASALGDYNNLEDVRKSIRNALEERARESYHQEYDRKILDKAIEQTSYKYPPQMVDREVERFLEDLERRLKNQGIELDMYLKMRNMDLEALRTDARPNAEKSLKQSLFLVELAKVENIKIEQDELSTETYNTLGYLSQTLPEKEAKRLSDDNIVRGLMSNIASEMLYRKAMDRFRDLCSGKVSEALEKNELAEEIISVSEENPQPTEPPLPLENSDERVNDSSPIES